MSAAADEAERQRSLMAVLLGDAHPATLAGRLRDGGAGLDAYRAHAAMLAGRVLAAAHPTLQRLIGEEAFAALARRHWRDDPPRAGDLALWGEGLADAIEATPELAGEPYLADVARLDWAVHAAERAADAAPPRGIEQLGAGDPAALRLRLQPGTAIIVSPHPVATIRAAHAAGAGASHWGAARAALADGRAENALVTRAGWRADVACVDGATARFTAALLAGHNLAAALDAAGPDFGFEPWLIDALRAGRIVAVEPVDGAAPA